MQQLTGCPCYPYGFQLSELTQSVYDSNEAFLSMAEVEDLLAKGEKFYFVECGESDFSVETYVFGSNLQYIEAGDYHLEWIIKIYQITEGKGVAYGRQKEFGEISDAAFRTDGGQFSGDLF